MEQFSAAPARGLSDTEAYARLIEFGRNESSEPPLFSRVMSRLKPLLKNPLILLLLALGSVAYLAGDRETAFVIWLMMALAVAIQLLQEIRAQQSLSALTRGFKTSCTVLRGPEGRTQVSVDSSALVPGDVVVVVVGDLVAADCLCVGSNGLRVNQSTITGESAAVKKQAVEGFAFQENAQVPAVVLTGSIVMSGSGLLRVCRTGDGSHIGQTLTQLRAAEDAADENIHRFTMIMIRFIAVMAPLVLLIQVAQHGMAMEPFMYAVSVSVGLAPEMLPMIICACLVSAATSVERVCLVRRLNAVHSLATMSLLCTDKTGTLTKDEMEVEDAVDCDGLHSEVVLAMARINSFFLENHGNAVEQALQRGVDREGLATGLAKVAEEPFNFDSRYASTVFRLDKLGQDHPELPVLQSALGADVFSKKKLLVCKGACSEVVALCSKVRVRDNATKALRENSTVIPQVRNVMLQNEAKGVRLLAVAIKCDSELDESGPNGYACSNGGLTLLGFVTFADQPKPSASVAVKSLESLGISVRMLTGDAKNVATAVAAKVGIANPSFVMIGSEIDSMNVGEDPVALYQGVQGFHIFAELNPR